MKERVVMSWSGGKDSAIALHELLRSDAYEAVSLLTTVSEECRRICHHGVSESLLDEQAGAIGIPLRKVYLPSGEAAGCSNEVYVSASYLWWKRLRTTTEAKFVNAREELNFGGPNFDIEDYSFMNFAAEYEVNPHMSLFGRIDNLTNEHYAEVFGFPALGRAVYGGVKVRF